MLAAYRALHSGDRAAIPGALRLGLLYDDDAVEELFAADADTLTLDADHIRAVWGLLRGDAGRKTFQEKLAAFTGVIEEDYDGDGVVEARAVYRRGMLQRFEDDADQDGEPEVRLDCAAGLPVSGTLSLYRAGRRGKTSLEVVWEAYPQAASAVWRAGEEWQKYFFRPGEGAIAPVRLSPLAGDALLYPRRAAFFSSAFTITPRTLAAMAEALERPSQNFAGAVERIELRQGVPLAAQEFVFLFSYKEEDEKRQKVAETEFVLGRPRLQRLDLDLDGRMETVRHFAAGDGGAYLVESDWDGDGLPEYREEYRDGKTLRSWELTPGRFFYDDE